MSSSTKPSVLDGAKIAAESRTQMKCGDCLHFQNGAHPGIGELCEARGVKKYATAPDCFTPNVHVFRKTSPKAFSLLASIVPAFTASQSRVFIGLLQQQAALERQGLHFLERVYFLVGNDYLDNYYAAYVLGVGPEKQILLVGSDYLKTQKGVAVAQLAKSSLISAEEFRKIKADLANKGLIYEPRRPHKNSIPDALKYEPPTLETPLAVLEQAARSNGKKKRKAASASDSHSGNTVFEVEL